MMDKEQRDGFGSDAHIDRDGDAEKHEEDPKPSTALVATGLSPEYVEARNEVYKLLDSMGANDIAVVTVVHVQERSSCQHNRMLSQRYVHPAHVIGIIEILLADYVKQTSSGGLGASHPLALLLTMAGMRRKSDG